VSGTSTLRLQGLSGDFVVCRLRPDDVVPGWADAAGSELVSITRTREELSIVAPSDRVPDDVTAERGWRGLAVRGPLDFGQVGILARLARSLAAARISIFVISTYDTDVLLVKGNRYDQAVAALRRDGCLVD
jgi:hypothetical protein